MSIQLKHLPVFYKAYVDLVPEDEVMEAIINSGVKLRRFLEQLPEETGNYRYADNKWTVKQVLSHVIDAERIFSYRALRFSRNDKIPLPGFEENDYVPESNAHNRTIKQLHDEFKNLRQSTIDLYLSFTPEMLERFGDANGSIIDVKSLGFVIAGHVLHHHNILKDRYNLS